MKTLTKWIKALRLYFVMKRSKISPCINDAMFENNRRYLELYNDVMNAS